MAARSPQSFKTPRAALESLWKQGGSCNSGVHIRRRAALCGPRRRESSCWLLAWLAFAPLLRAPPPRVPVWHLAGLAFAASRRRVSSCRTWRRGGPPVRLSGEKNVAGDLICAAFLGETFNMSVVLHAHRNPLKRPARRWKDCGSKVVLAESGGEGHNAERAGKHMRSQTHVGIHARETVIYFRCPPAPPHPTTPQRA